MDAKPVSSRSASSWDSLLLRELIQGMALTGATWSRASINDRIPEEKIAGVAALSRAARAAPLPEKRRRRGGSHRREQRCAGGRRPALAIPSNRRQAADGHPTHARYLYIDLTSAYLRFCEGKLSGRFDRRNSHILEYHGEERRGDLTLYQGELLLASGDANEKEGSRRLRAAWRLIVEGVQVRWLQAAVARSSLARIRWRWWRRTQSVRYFSCSRACACWGG